MEKYKMYVSVVDQRVYSFPDDSTWEYEVDIERDYVPIFQRLFDQQNDLEFQNFFRAHLPYLPYHYDRVNHDVDLRTKKVYALIHEFTDEESKALYRTVAVFPLIGCFPPIHWMKGRDSI